MIGRLWLALLLVPLAAPLHAADEQATFSLPSGTQITASLRWPDAEDAGRAPLPAVMLFGGLEGTRQVLEVMPTDQAAVLASFPYPYLPPRRLDWRGLKPAADDFGQAVADTFAGIEQLTGYLRAHPRVDPTRITIVGASAGAPFAGISAQRLALPGLIVIQGFGDLPTVLGHQAYLAWDGDGGWVRRGLCQLLGWLLVSYLDLPDPAAFARRMQAPQRVLMMTAVDDHRVPAAATEALWDGFTASGAQRRRIDQPGDHLRGLGDARIPQIMRTATDWMRDNDLL